jgi:hypothetical protein
MNENVCALPQDVAKLLQGQSSARAHMPAVIGLRAT